MSRSKVRSGKVRFDSDVTMKQLWQCLYQDFERPSAAHRHVDAIRDSVVSFRTEPWPNYMALSPYEFKRAYQLEYLLKRYTFHKDIHTQQSLNTLTNEKYLALQASLSRHAEGNYPLWLLEVIRTARRMVAEVLGPYDKEEHFSLCKFGSKATYGNALHKSYLDTKISGLKKDGDDFISGSVKQIEWFKNYLVTDNLLSTITEDQRYVPCYYLRQNNVPKSFKALRGIQPNTTIGSFYTSGLGRMIQKRLKSVGIDIRFQQEVHRRFIKQASVDRKHVTADLSSASHCFTSALVNRLVPRQWYNALKLGRIDKVMLLPCESKIYHQESFMAMGIGYTFPLQTLLFYCLIRAVEHLLREKRGFVSVYGDDLIYPIKIHKFVSATLEGLGFKLNMDKTYVEQPFRESCGSDFFRGIDVRPFSTEGSYRGNSATRYLFFLYKTINGLLRRWDKCEVQKAYRFLILEILRCRPQVFQVPEDYPDYSGIKMSSFESFDIEIPWVKPTVDANGSWRVFSLGTLRRNRFVNTIDVYCWDWLRSHTQDDTEYHYRYDDSVTPTITWLPAAKQPKNYRGMDGKRIKLLKPCVPEKGADVTPCFVTGLRVR